MRDSSFADSSPLVMAASSAQLVVGAGNTFNYASSRSMSGLLQTDTAALLTVIPLSGPDTEATEMHHRLLSVREQLAVTKKAEKQLEEALIETQHATPDGPRYVTEQVRSPSSYFDKAAFEATHPRIAARFISEDDSTPMVPSRKRGIVLISVTGRETE